MRRTWTVAAALALAGILGLGGCGRANQETYQELSSEYDNLSEIAEQLRSDYDEATRKNDEQQKELDTLKEERDALEQEYLSYREQAQPYIEYVQALQSGAESFGGQAAVLPEGQTEAWSEAQAAETAAAAYETGITYENLLENPKKCMGKKIRFTGTIVDAELSGDDLFLIIAVDQSADKPLLLSAPAAWADSGIEYGMLVTVYGESAGLYEEAVAGGEPQRMPGAVVDYIVQG